MRTTAVKASVVIALLPPVLIHEFLNLTRDGKEHLKPEKNSITPQLITISFLGRLHSL
jgi:hypothetical protein